jgi:single-strand DNA-binding protein
MASLNRVLLIGNLTRNPELTYNQKGTPVASIGLAVNRAWLDEAKVKHEEVVFIDIRLWARLAEIAQQYLHKGSLIFIDGRLQLDTWDDKQTGQKRSKLYVVGENLQFLGKREGAETSSPRPALERPERRQPPGRPPHSNPFSTTFLFKQP